MELLRNANHSKHSQRIKKYVSKLGTKYKAPTEFKKCYQYDFENAKSSVKTKNNLSIS